MLKVFRFQEIIPSTQDGAKTVKDIVVVRMSILPHLGLYGQALFFSLFRSVFHHTLSSVDSTCGLYLFWHSPLSLSNLPLSLVHVSMQLHREYCNNKKITPGAGRNLQQKQQTTSF